MRRISLQSLGPVIGLALFFFALYVLSRVLGENSYQQILRHISAYPAGRMLAAVGLTAVSYGLLSLYDHLALRYLGRRLGPVRVTMASFINYCFSRNVGFALLSGGSIRYRFYSAWGLSAVEIARLISFAAVTFLLGFLSMGGALLLLSPAALPEMPLPQWAFAPLGASALLLVASYLMLVSWRRQPLRLGRWEVSLPTKKLAIAQLVVGASDWTLKAGILYYLLAEEVPLSLPAFLEVYLLAQIVATVSHVPGGLGVFEAVIVTLVPEVAPSDLLAILLVYRGIYFLLPFGGAIVLLGALEAVQNAEIFRRARRYLGEWLSPLAPPVFAAAVLVAGAIVLFSCATPTMADRLDLTGEWIPLPLVNVSHFLLALAGTGLILLARGLQRRLSPAYRATQVLLAFAIGLTLLKGMTFEQAGMLLLLFLALIPGRALFDRPMPLYREPFPLRWVTLVLIPFGGALWLVSISYDTQSLDPGLWRRIDLSGDDARSLRAVAGSAAVLTTFLLLRLRSRQQARPKLPDAATLTTCAGIIIRQPSAAANLALAGDKVLLFSEPEDAFIMFARSERYWIALGDPIGERERVGELLWCFQEMCESDGGVPVFCQIAQEHRSLYHDMGMTLLPVGEDATVALTPGGRNERRAGPRVGAAACRLTVDDHPEPSLVSRLEQLARGWTGDLRAGSYGFSRGRFQPDYCGRFPLAILQGDDGPQAFALILPGGDREEFTLDLLHFSPRGGVAVAERLVRELLAWGRENGFAAFSFGVVPSRDRQIAVVPSPWHGRSPWTSRNGHSFPSADAWRQFVERFSPSMRPRYAAFPGWESTERVLGAVADLMTRSSFPSATVAAAGSERLHCDAEKS